MIACRFPYYSKIGLDHLEDCLDKCDYMALIRHYNISYGEHESCAVVCPICHDNMKELYMRTRCNHIFCAECIFTIAIKHASNHPSCSMCRTPWDIIGFRDIVYYRINDALLPLNGT